DSGGIAAAVLGRVKHSVQAVPTATLCVLQGRGFSDLFTQHPGWALNLLQTRVEEEQRMDVRLSMLGRSTAEQRIAYLMLETFDRVRQRGIVNGGATPPVPLPPPDPPAPPRRSPGQLLAAAAHARAARRPPA